MMSAVETAGLWIQGVDKFVPATNPLQAFWGFLFDRFSPFALTTYVPFIILITTYLCFNGPLLAAEYYDWAPLRKYKLQKVTNDRALTMRCLKQLAFNYSLVMLPMEMISFFVFEHLGFQITRQIPPWYVVAGQMLAFLFIEDTAHYFAHRFLHLQKWGIYRAVHRIHHEFSAPYGIAASYAHPVEVVLLGMCTFAGPLIFRPHMAVFILWVNLRQFTAIETHSGYDLPFSPAKWFPFAGGAEFHDFHHRTINGNYSSNFTHWDRLFGTDSGFVSFKRKERLKKQGLTASADDLASKAQ
jgi:sterol desaturase/sphingolipid hydroxylase (fatty acid hydroxylase superfamily)